jgi:hypothetical protein
MNLTEVKELKYREVLIHTPSGTRWYVNGKVQTWVTRPNDVKVPLKHGLYDHSYLTDQNMRDFVKE